MKQKRVHGGSKERKLRNKTEKSMDMNSLYADLPSVRRKITPTSKQRALDAEKSIKALKQAARSAKKTRNKTVKGNVDELSILFGKIGL